MQHLSPHGIQGFCWSPAFVVSLPSFFPLHSLSAGSTGSHSDNLHVETADVSVSYSSAHWVLIQQTLDFLLSFLFHSVINSFSVTQMYISPSLPPCLPPQPPCEWMLCLRILVHVWLQACSDWAAAAALH